MTLGMNEISFPHYDCSVPYYWQQTKQEQNLARGNRAADQGSRPACSSKAAQVGSGRSQGSRLPSHLQGSPGGPSQEPELQTARASATGRLPPPPPGRPRWAQPGARAPGWSDLLRKGSPRRIALLTRGRCRWRGPLVTSGDLW